MSVTVSDVLAALAYAGIGAGLGTVGAAAITSRSGKSEARAHAADLVANAAGNLADRVTRLNEKLELEISHKDKAILLLTEVIDEIINDLPNLTAEKIAELRAANHAAKLAL